nr:P80 family lipoprotein [Mycoplasmopsis canis]
MWGQKVANADTVLEKYKKDNFKLSKDIFESYDKLVEFSTIAQSLFSESSKGTNSSVHVFGIDDMTGVYEQALFSALDGNKSNMLQTVSTNNGKIEVNFNSIKNKSGAAYTKSQEIFSTFTSAFEKGAVYAFPSGQYSSNDQTKHKFAFSIGSTAGYFHNFKKGGSSVTTVSHPGSSYEFELSNFGGAYEFKDKGKTTGALAYIGSYANAIVPSTAYDYVSKSVEDDAKITSLFSKSEKNKTLNLIFELSKTATGKLADYIKELEKDPSVQKYSIIKKSDNKEYVVYSFENVLTGGKDLAFTNNTFANHKVKVFSHTSLLNEEELISIPTPGKWKPENAKKVLFAQGPSLIGIKSNDEDESATKAFVKWLVTYDKEVTLGKNNNIPHVELQKSASYISALKGLKDKTKEESSKIYGNNKYLEIAYNEFVISSKEDYYVVFEEPAGSGSDSFRKNIGTAWETVQSGYVNKTTTKKSFDEFVKDMTKGINN